ncbi:hypothetical protein IMSAGC014_00531 [Bacteroidaceae bacterium]|nr:hypothetical protein IMSAGC014_00531 [Bacteroidaceae bacterium]
MNPSWWENLILTQFAFGRKMLYICNSGAGLSIGIPRFSFVFQVILNIFYRVFIENSPYCNFNSPYSS